MLDQLEATLAEVHSLREQLAALKSHAPNFTVELSERTGGGRPVSSSAATRTLTPATGKSPGGSRPDSVVAFLVPESLAPNASQSMLAHARAVASPLRSRGVTPAPGALAHPNSQWSGILPVQPSAAEVSDSSLLLPHPPTADKPVHAAAPHRAHGAVDVEATDAAVPVQARARVPTPRISREGHRSRRMHSRGCFLCFCVFSVLAVRARC